MNRYIEEYRNGATVYGLIRDEGMTAEESVNLLSSLFCDDVAQHHKSLAEKVVRLSATLPCSAISKRTGASIGTVNKIIKERNGV